MGLKRNLLVLGLAGLLSVGSALAAPVTSVNNRSSVADVSSYLKTGSQGLPTQQILAKIVDANTKDGVPVGVVIAAVESAFGSDMVLKTIPLLIHAGAPYKDVIAAAIVSGVNSKSVVKTAILAGVDPTDAQTAANDAENGSGGGGTTGTTGVGANPTGTPVPGGGGGGTAASPS